MKRKVWVLCFGFICLFYNLGFSQAAENVLVRYKEYMYNKAAFLLSDYIKIPSLSGDELQAGKFFANYCQQEGLHLAYFDKDTSNFNFAATIYPLESNKPVIWFQHHIDVVNASTPELWQFPPYAGVISNDTIYGRGAIDCKGLGVMQLIAVLEFRDLIKQEELPFNVGLLCLSGEESANGTGVKNVLTENLELLKPALVLGEGGAGLKGVLSSNPDRTVYGISVAEKIPLWLELRLEMKSFGHGATPASNYANKDMIEALSRLNNRKIDLEFNRTNRRMFRKLGKEEGGVRGFMIKHMNWWVLRPLVKPVVNSDPLLESLLTNTITVTKIQNPPGPPNSISTISTAYLDCRLQPGTSKKAFIRKLKSILDDQRIEIVEINESPEAKATSPGKLFNLLKDAVLKEDPEAAVIPVLFPASTDNTYFRHYGIPTYGLIPAIFDKEVISSVHNVDEKLPVAALKKGIRIYTNFLYNLYKADFKIKERFSEPSEDNSLLVEVPES